MDIFKNITDENNLQIDPKTLKKSDIANKLILPLIMNDSNRNLEILNKPQTNEALQIKLKKLKKFKNKKEALITEGI